MLRTTKLLVLIALLTSLLILWEGYLRKIMYGVPFSCSAEESETYLKLLVSYSL